MTHQTKENDQLANDIDSNRVKGFLRELQDAICSALEQVDGEQVFVADSWEREQGGGGESRVLSNGGIFEQAGVNFSHVFGESLPRSATAKRPQLEGRSYEAMGVSLVIHPKNPMIPTTHANFRFFIASKEGEQPIWWFGGGLDLTPYYPFREDVIEWHQYCRDAAPEYYALFKKQCDDYFYLPHRQEQRGVGGLFFDDFNQPDFNSCFNTTKSVADCFLPAYLNIVNKRKNMPYTDNHRDFQLYRRGRYVEFNLVYDRGTLFGLQTGGRTESILMSMPPLVKWQYNWQPESGSEEARLYHTYLKPQDWLGIEANSSSNQT